MKVRKKWNSRVCALELCSTRKLAEAYFRNIFPPPYSPERHLSPDQPLLEGSSSIKTQALDLRIPEKAANCLWAAAGSCLRGGLSASPQEYCAFFHLPKCQSSW
ncbi:hypothetical protein CDAR_315251 [Caerostris darwini]|uniref:Uncharacterized protein n=1 Tax=Caerostris darwini TaxID=1538125 RepID=A0AAV4TCH6_9ARAC|nr:hypothetical protein CDAR_315251 [Caerostris darwini]